MGNGILQCCNDHADPVTINASVNNLVLRNVSDQVSSEAKNTWQTWTSSSFQKAFGLGGHMGQVGQVEKLSLLVKWKDQGWGNRKGTIYVRANPASGWTRLPGGHAPHKWSYEMLSIPLKVVSEAKATQHLEFSYSVGGGGGHQLFLREARIDVQYLQVAYAVSVDAVSVSVEPTAFRTKGGGKIEERLANLFKLKTTGCLSQSEYDAAKKIMLNEGVE